LARVIIETAELTISKRVVVPNNHEKANVVGAIVAVVDAFDAADEFKFYNIKEHLLAALKKPK